MRVSGVIKPDLHLGYGREGLKTARAIVETEQHLTRFCLKLTFLNLQNATDLRKVFQIITNNSKFQFKELIKFFKPFMKRNFNFIIFLHQLQF